MNVTFEEKDALHALLTIELNPEDYQPKVDAELKKYRSQASVPGFRPGKAPLSVIKKMVGKAMLVDEINKLASNTLMKHLEDNKIDILGQPLASKEQDGEMNFDEPKDFTFKFDLGLAPKFDLNISTKDKLTRHKIEVSDEELEKEVDNNLRRFGTMLEIKETENDQDTVKGMLTELDKDGNPLEGGVSDKETTVLLEMVKDKKTQKSLLGKKVGDKVQVDIFKFFNDNEKVMASTVGLPAEGIKDLNKTFELDITEIKRFQKAELNQELYDQVFGKDVVKTEEEFRTKLRENLEQYYGSEAEHQLDHSISHLIMDNHKMELPDEFLKRWLIQTYPDNYNEENIDELYGRESDSLRRQLIMEKVVADFKLEITQEDINDVSIGYTAQMLRQYGMGNPDLETIRYFEQKNREEDPNYLRRVGDIAVDRKVTDQVKSMVTIKEKKTDVEAFYKMIEKHNAEHNH